MASKFFSSTEQAFSIGFGNDDRHHDLPLQAAAEEAEGGPSGGRHRGSPVRDRFGVIGGQNRRVPGASWAAIDGHRACAG